MGFHDSGVSCIIRYVIVFLGEYIATPQTIPAMGQGFPSYNSTVFTSSSFSILRDLQDLSCTISGVIFDQRGHMFSISPCGLGGTYNEQVSGRAFSFPPIGRLFGSIVVLLINLLGTLDT